MTLPPVPRRRPDLVPRGYPTVDPDHQTQRAHPCRCPCGAPAGCPPSATRSGSPSCRRAATAGADDLVVLSLRLAETRCGPLYGRRVSPDRELAAAAARLAG
jgi:hypothetical protein